MKILNFLLFCSVVLFANAQILKDGTNLTKRSDIYYIEVDITWDDVGKGYRMDVDYGSLRSSPIITTDGKKLKLRSKMAVFNYLHKRGWNYIESKTISGVLNRTVILFERSTVKGNSPQSLDH